MQRFLEPDNLIILLLGLALMGLVAGVSKRYSLWKQGKPTQGLKTSLLLTVPKRYFVDLHHIVMRDRYMAYTHVAVAGGVIASAVLILPIYVLGSNSVLIYGLFFLAALSAFVGAFFVFLRRVNKPARLSGGKWNAVPIALLSFSLGLGLLTAIHSGFINKESVRPGTMALLCVLAGLGVFELAGGTLFSRPLKHLISGSLHLAFHPRQDRFKKKGNLSTDLKPVEWESEEPGVQKLSDFPWNRLLGFDACVECGKCESACPAFAAEQPLNPKKLIQDFVVALEGKTDARYAGSPTPGIAVGQHGGNAQSELIPTLIEGDTLWSCTSCRACVQECPMMIEHVDAIVDIRRGVVLQKGNIPAKSFEVLENLRATENVQGNKPAQRANWALDAGVRILKPGEKTDVLFWAGEAAFELRHWKTLQTLAKLLRKADIDFAIMGESEADVGDLARRIGDEALFEKLAKENIERLKQYQFKRILTADPHVYHSLNKEYPHYGGDYEVFHHTEFLTDLLARGRLTVKEKIKGKTFSYHDPCYLGRYNGITDAPRKLLAYAAENTVEMEKSGMRSRCCGWGGGAAFSDVPGKRRIPDMRMNDVRETQADSVVVSCPNCMTMLDGVVDPKPAVVDIVELVEQAVT